jgi:hypothetical protein
VPLLITGDDWLSMGYGLLDEICVSVREMFGFSKGVGSVG